MFFIFAFLYLTKCIFGVLNFQNCRLTLFKFQNSFYRSVECDRCKQTDRETGFKTVAQVVDYEVYYVDGHIQVLYDIYGFYCVSCMSFLLGLRLVFPWSAT